MKIRFEVVMSTFIKHDKRTNLDIMVIQFLNINKWIANEDTTK